MVEGSGLENRQWGHTQPEFESLRLRHQRLSRHVRKSACFSYFLAWQEKIDVLQTKFKKYKDIDDEFYREVNKAYKEKLKRLYMKKVALENSISTATSVNDYLYQFKKVLSP